MFIYSTSFYYNVDKTLFLRRSLENVTNDEPTEREKNDEARLSFYKTNSTTMSIIAYLSRISIHKLSFLALVRPGQSFIDSIAVFYKFIN